MFLFDRLALIYDADKLISYYEHIPEEGYGFMKNQLQISIIAPLGKITGIKYRQ